jgi:hypothetical protein
MRFGSPEGIAGEAPSSVTRLDRLGCGTAADDAIRVRRRY